MCFSLTHLLLPFLPQTGLMNRDSGERVEQDDERNCVDNLPMVVDVQAHFGILDCFDRRDDFFEWDLEHVLF